MPFPRMLALLLVGAAWGAEVPVTAVPHRDAAVPGITRVGPPALRFLRYATHLAISPAAKLVAIAGSHEGCSKEATAIAVYGADGLLHGVPNECTPTPILGLSFAGERSVVTYHRDGLRLWPAQERHLHPTLLAFPTDEEVKLPCGPVVDVRGKRVAAVDGAGALHIWELPGGALRSSWRRPPHPIHAAAFRGDSAQLWISTRSVGLGVLDLEKEPLSLVTHSELPPAPEVGSATFTRDGVLMATWFEGAIHVLEPTSGLELVQIPAPSLPSADRLALSPAGRHLVHQRPGDLLLYDLQAPGEPQAFLGHAVPAIADDPGIWAADAGSGVQLGPVGSKTWRNHPVNGMNQVVFQPGGQALFTVDTQGAYHHWSLRDPTAIAGTNRYLVHSRRSTRGHETSLMMRDPGALYHPGREELLVTDGGRWGNLGPPFDAAYQAPVIDKTKVGSGARLLGLSPSGKWVLVTSSTKYPSLEVRDVTGQEVALRVAEVAGTRAAFWHPRKDQVLFSRRDGTLEVGDLTAGAPATRKLLGRLDQACTAMAVHPSGAWFLCAGGAKDRRIPLRKGESPATLPGRSSRAAFSYDGRWLARLTGPQEVTLASCGDPTPRLRLRFPAAVQDLRPDPEGPRLAVAVGEGLDRSDPNFGQGNRMAPVATFLADLPELLPAPCEAARGWLGQ